MEQQDAKGRFKFRGFKGDISGFMKVQKSWRTKINSPAPHLCIYTFNKSEAQPKEIKPCRLKI